MSCKQYTISINAGETSTIVTKSPLSFVAQKFILVASMTGSQGQFAYELLLSYTGTAPNIQPAFVLYAGVGEELDFTVDAIYNGSDIAVTITNNESSSILFDLAEMGTVT